MIALSMQDCLTVDELYNLLTEIRGIDSKLGRLSVFSVGKPTLLRGVSDNAQEIVNKIDDIYIGEAQGDDWVLASWAERIDERYGERRVYVLEGAKEAMKRKLENDRIKRQEPIFDRNATTQDDDAR